MAAGDSNLPKIGIPWRTSQEESEQNRPRIQNYEDAVRRAGATPVLVSLCDAEGLPQRLEELAGFVLPGSPADVEPAEYGARNLGLSEPADMPRERTDRAILDHAFRAKKPVLAICYGCQLLNVYLGGTLIQDVRNETGTSTAHRKTDLPLLLRIKDPEHPVRFEAGSLLARLAGRPHGVVNSSHHQAVQKPGRALKVTGLSSDGIVESLEWSGDTNWVVAVQWHPERMKDDALAQKLFTEFVAAVVAREKTPAKR
jgi:putative glutamine amidotransferase